MRAPVERRVSRDRQQGRRLLDAAFCDVLATGLRHRCAQQLGAARSEQGAVAVEHAAGRSDHAIARDCGVRVGQQPVVVR